MQKSSRSLVVVCLVAAPLAAAIVVSATDARAARPAAAAPTVPTLPGQAAFAAIGEIVRILDNDPNTDWSKVDVEALRQHLIDMDLVTMRASVAQRPIAGGFEAHVTGQGPTVAAIKRMVTNQSRMLSMMGEYNASAEPVAAGVRFVVTVRDSSNARAVSRLRGLGFAGVIAEGDHHTSHHLAVARGDPDPHSHR